MEKSIILLIILIILSFISYNYNQNKIDKFQINNTLCIIITTYNPGLSYLKKCLNSIEKQTYKNYKLCILDDGSERTTEYIDLIEDFCNKNNWNSILSDNNVGALKGRIMCIENLNPNNEDIIVSIDGDDELFDENVFDKINNFYQDDNLITFGNWINIKKDEENNIIESKPRLKCRKYNFKQMIKNNSFRESKWIFSHLKTFKYKLFKKIKNKDFLVPNTNTYFKSATDLALMYPLLEMSNGRFKCVDDVLYKYNHHHVNSNHNNDIKKIKQTNNAKIIKQMQKYSSF